MITWIAAVLRNSGSPTGPRVPQQFEAGFGKRRSRVIAQPGWLASQNPYLATLVVPEVLGSLVDYAALVLRNHSCEP